MGEKPAPRGEIFVVDDDPAVRETLSVVLSAGGYEVIRLSVNVNKIALLRNSRGGNIPDVLRAARTCIAAGRECERGYSSGL